MQRTLVILKPECIANCVVGRVFSYFDDIGYRPIALRMETPGAEKMRSHYCEVIERVGEDVGNSIIRRMTRGPCIFAIYEGINSIDVVRKLIGPTNPMQASRGTIRGDLATSIEYNIIHASDSENSAKREIDIWFPEFNAN